MQPAPVQTDCALRGAGQQRRQETILPTGPAWTVVIGLKICFQSGTSPRPEELPVRHFLHTEANRPPLSGFFLDTAISGNLWR